MNVQDIKLVSYQEILRWRQAQWIWETQTEFRWIFISLSISYFHRKNQWSHQSIQIQEKSDSMNETGDAQAIKFGEFLFYGILKVNCNFPSTQPNGESEIINSFAGFRVSPSKRMYFEHILFGKIGHEAIFLCEAKSNVLNWDPRTFQLMSKLLYRANYWSSRGRAFVIAIWWIMSIADSRSGKLNQLDIGFQILNKKIKKSPLDWNHRK